MLSPLLFKPITFRDITLKNRIAVAPMCMYSANEGIANEFHLAHLGSLALGGSGLIIVEATGVEMRGRISQGCLSIETNEQTEAFKPITKLVKSLGAVIGIQLAHAGRKASFSKPTHSNPSVYLHPSNGGWETIAPSSIAFDDKSSTPKEMTNEDIEIVIESFKRATRNAFEAGFELVEIHSAHGYLLHEFLSPISNKRNDEFGGSLENRMRFPLMVAKAVREAFPKHLPVFLRLSATDWTEGGWNIEDSIQYSKELKKIGIDLIDTSTGGNVPNANIPVAPGYQVEFSNQIKNQADIKTGAVGLITDVRQAENILLKEQADLILLGRELLRNPHWPMKAAKELSISVPFLGQYLRGF